MGRDAELAGNELRAVAALIVTGPSPQLVGPCTLVTNGTHVVAFSSADLLRSAGEPLAIALTNDGKKTLAVTAWRISRTPHMGLIDLGTAFPFGEELDVEPLPIAAICATVDTRGARSAFVAVRGTGSSIERRLIPVHVDTIDGGDVGDDVITRLASPDHASDVRADVDGAPLFSWLPADLVLRRPPEVVVVALGCSYRAGTFKPRDLAAVAELYGLEDLGRALPWSTPEPGGGSNELPQIAGEIRGSESADREGD